MFIPSGISLSDVVCPELPEILNGKQSPEHPDRPGRVTFTCDPGLILKGPKALMCTEAGKWDPNKMPFCDGKYDTVSHWNVPK